MIKMTVEAFKHLVRSRSFAYRRTFALDNPAAQQVLGDLSKFCRAHVSTFHRDDRIHAVLEGRREVWLRIQEYLNLTEEQIYKMHKVYETQNTQEN